MAETVQTGSLSIEAVEGAVLVEGPNGSPVTLTVDVAIDAGHRLIEAAETANVQRIGTERDQRRASNDASSIRNSSWRVLTWAD
jgi:hypothetical protein